MRDAVPNSEIVIVANKVDLVSKEQLNAIAQETPLAWDYATSAKTGENVEALFKEMAKRLLDQM